MSGISGMPGATERDSVVTPFLLLLIVVVMCFCACIFGYNLYRSNAEKRAREKRRNMFNDRV